MHALDIVGAVALLLVVVGIWGFGMRHIWLSAHGKTGGYWLINNGMRKLPGVRRFTTDPALRDTLMPDRHGRE